MNKFMLGWSQLSSLDLNLDLDSLLVRIVKRHRSSYLGMTETGEPINCYLKGSYLNQSNNFERPAVGDWCIVAERFIDSSNSVSAMIEKVLPRAGYIARLASGEEYKEQVLAANVQYGFIVSSCNRDFKINRLRRFITLCKSGLVTPVVVISKVDLANHELLARVEEELNESFPSIEYLLTSIYSSEGKSKLLSYFDTGTTAVFLGSSGVGKSSLVNSLLNRAVARTGAIRSTDSRGRHTTSSTDMFFLQEEGIIIDTPGLREVGMLGSFENESGTGNSIEELARDCKYRDCSHRQEPGCSVQAALDRNDLKESEYASYRQLEKEIAFSSRKRDQRLAKEERKKWKKISVNNRRRNKARNSY